MDRTKAVEAAMAEMVEIGPGAANPTTTRRWVLRLLAGGALGAALAGAGMAGDAGAKGKPGKVGTGEQDATRGRQGGKGGEGAVAKPRRRGRNQDAAAQAPDLVPALDAPPPHGGEPPVGGDRRVRAAAVNSLMTVRGSVVRPDGSKKPYATVTLFRWNGAAAQQVRQVRANQYGDFAVVAERGYWYYVQVSYVEGTCPVQYLFYGYSNWFGLSAVTSNPYPIGGVRAGTPLYLC